MRDKLFRIDLYTLKESESLKIKNIQDTLVLD